MRAFVGALVALSLAFVAASLYHLILGTAPLLKAYPVQTREIIQAGTLSGFLAYIISAALCIRWRSKTWGPRTIGKRLFASIVATFGLGACGSLLLYAGYRGAALAMFTLAVLLAPVLTALLSITKEGPITTLVSVFYRDDEINRF